MSEHSESFCTTCFQQPADPDRADSLCAACGHWQDYWEGLPHLEREHEQAMMAAYATESSVG
jgi:hypothetical protein